MLRIKQQNMFSDDEEDEEIGEEFVDRLLSQINSDTQGYVDVEDIKDSVIYLQSVGRRDDAYALLGWGLQTHVDNTTLLLLRASQLVDNDEIEKGRKLLNYLEDSAKETPSYQFNLAILNLRDGDEKEALEHFERSFALAPEDERGPYMIDAAAALCRSEYYDDAVIYYSQLSKDELFSEPTWAFEYAYALDRLGLDDEATEAYLKVVEMDPWNGNAWNNIGIEYAKKDNLEESVEAYQKSTDANPNNPSPYFNMGNSYKAMEKDMEAIDCYTEYISLVAMQMGDDFLKEVDPMAFQRIGECWGHVGNFDNAIRFLTLVTHTLMKESDSGWYYLGRCFVGIGDNNAAVAAYKAAIKINGEDADYYYALAEALLNIGDTKGCVKNIEVGISKSPNNVLAWFEVIRIKLSMMTDKAAVEIGSYIEEMKVKYEAPAALQLVEAYIDYFVYGKKKKALALIRSAATKTPSVIREASIEPSLSKLFEQKEIKQLLKAFDITL